MTAPDTTRTWPWVVFVCVMIGLAVADALTALQHAGHFAHTYGYWIETTVSIPLFAAVGAVICTRVPANAVGPVMLGMACTSVLQDLGGALALTGVHNAWPNLLIGFMGGLFAAAQLATVSGDAVLLFLAPTGRPLTQRWSRVLLGFIVVAGVGVAASLFAGPNPDSLAGYPCSPPVASGQTCNGSGAGLLLPHPSSLANGLAMLGNVALVVGLLLGCVTIALRWARSRGLDRQRVTWVVLGGLAGPAIVLVDLAIAPILSASAQSSQLHGSLVWGAAGAAFPLGIAVAVLRHGLYDLDRVVSRTVSYAIVSGTVLAIYVATVGLLSWLVPGKSALPVAAATLVAAAAFQPVLRRVRALVDRRFNREHYDALRTVDEFSRTLRHVIHTDDVERRLLHAVSSTLEPETTRVWLSPRPATGVRT